jgi:predicted membrane channel-forming protein YqfA (hemolysin III family)
MLTVFAMAMGIIVYLVGAHLYRSFTLQSLKDSLRGTKRNVSPDTEEDKEIYQYYDEPKEKVVAREEYPDIESRARPTDAELVDQMKQDKQLYHKLQNLEQYPGESGVFDSMVGDSDR